VKKRALVAVGHSILVILYHMLKDGCPYSELGSDFSGRVNHDRLTLLFPTHRSTRPQSHAPTLRQLEWKIFSGQSLMPLRGTQKP